MRKLEKGILFNTEMVKKILKGRKTTTRRIVKLDFKKVYTMACANGKWLESYGETLPEHLKEWYVKEKAKPPYQVGDILYVRETWSTQYDGIHDNNGYGIYVYKADGTILDNSEGISSSHWYPSIHMPKVAARIFLKVTNVKVQRIQDITEDEAQAEGCYGVSYNVTDGKENNRSREWFKILWNRLYNNWDENPWVWVIEFERIK